MVAQGIGTAAVVASGIPAGGAARTLGPAERKELSVAVLARTQPLTQLAARHGVSRKFLYEQGHKAEAALDETFAAADDDRAVRYCLPVSKAWMRQFVLGLALEGHSSYRGICQLAQDLLDYPDLSVGTIHNILHRAADQARLLNQAQDLTGIRVGAHDEIYQAGRPVLVGADVRSTYCYLLSEEEHCDETTWGVRLLDLAAQGLRPDYTVGDGGLALRAGQAAAWEDVPCHGDVFHAERELGKLAFYLGRRATGCISARRRLEHQRTRQQRRGRGNGLSQQLALARQAELQAVALAQDVRVLADWLQQDILSLAGQRDDLLAFAGVLEEEFAALAGQFQVPAAWVQQLCQREGRDPQGPAYWREQGPLRAKLREKFLPLQQAVRVVMADTTRASSLVENLNSRLRTYFFLRRELGNGYLDLLRFFLNHRRFPRSRRAERTGHSPAELLSGRGLPHWLELLGFERFRRN